jgi:hypothetical protein
MPLYFSEDGQGQTINDVKKIPFLRKQTPLFFVPYQNTQSRFAYFNFIIE